MVPHVDIGPTEGNHVETGVRGVVESNPPRARPERELPKGTTHTRIEDTVTEADGSAMDVAEKYSPQTGGGSSEEIMHLHAVQEQHLLVKPDGIHGKGRKMHKDSQRSLSLVEFPGKDFELIF